MILCSLYKIEILLRLKYVHWFATSQSLNLYTLQLYLYSTYKFVKHYIYIYYLHINSFILQVNVKAGSSCLIAADLLTRHGAMLLKRTVKDRFKLFMD